MYGWNPTREKTCGISIPRSTRQDYNTWDWGGTMIAHKLIQQENGDLSFTVPEAVDAAFTEPVGLKMTPLNGSWQLGADEAEVGFPYGYASLLMNRVSECASWK